MKIIPNQDSIRPDPRIEGAGNPASQTVSPAGQSVATAPVAPVQPIDKVLLSGAAQSLSEAGSPAFDVDKVAAVRKAIERGEFKINHDAIASKMINEAAELLETVSRKP
jgi:flagellar biosynthesis anti-sigma factor FlgM